MFLSDDDFEHGREGTFSTITSQVELKLEIQPLTIQYNFYVVFSILGRTWTLAVGPLLNTNVFLIIIFFDCFPYAFLYGNSTSKIMQASHNAFI